MDAYTPPWYYSMQPPHGMHRQHPPPTPRAPGPGPQGPPHPGMPMSPRTQPPSLPPGTPTMPHAVPTPHTSQPPPHSHQPSSSIRISSPPPTPVTSSGPGARLNTEARAFVPSAPPQHKTITIKGLDGIEVNLESLKKHSPQPSTIPIPPASPITTSGRTTLVGIESKKGKRKQQERARLEKEKKDTEEAERRFNEKICWFEEGRRRLIARWEEERNNSSFPPSSFTTARKIDSLDEIEYPEGIKGPKAELNRNAKDGKFRYMWTLTSRAWGSCSLFCP